MIPEHVKKLGYYQHNGNDYPNKWEALANCPAGEHVHWNFNDEIYSKYDWSKEPIHDLYELYKMRAIQIREEYDNVIVYFSGGIDSVCAIRSFLDNEFIQDVNESIKDNNPYKETKRISVFTRGGTSI